MSYELSIQQKAGYLHFRIQGENDRATVRNYFADILKECIQRNVYSILVEENLRGPGLRTLDIFQIAEEGTREAISLMRVIAYVDTNPEHSHDDMKFAATVASNRGLQVRVFPTVTEAQEWIISVVT